MGRNPSVEVYAPQRMLDAMEDIAESRGWSTTEAWRRAGAAFLQEQLEEGDLFEEQKQ